MKPSANKLEAVKKVTVSNCQGWGQFAIVYDNSLQRLKYRLRFIQIQRVTGDWAVHWLLLAVLSASLLTVVLAIELGNLQE